MTPKMGLPGFLVGTSEIISMEVRTSKFPALVEALLSVLVA